MSVAGALLDGYSASSKMALVNEGMFQRALYPFAACSRINSAFSGGILMYHVHNDQIADETAIKYKSSFLSFFQPLQF